MTITSEVSNWYEVWYKWMLPENCSYQSHKYFIASKKYMTNILKNKRHGWSHLHEEEDLNELIFKNIH